MKISVSKKVYYALPVFALIIGSYFYFNNIRVTPSVSLSNTKAATAALLSPNDFQFLGYMRVPSAVGSGGARGFAVKNVAGVTTFYVMGGPWDGNNPGIMEISDAGFGADISSAPQATVVKNWGDIANPNRLGVDGSNLTGSIMDYLHWSNNRLYWQYYDTYNVTMNDNPDMGFTTFNGTTTSQNYGPWVISPHTARTSGWIVDIPQWFADAYTNGATLGAGQTLTSGNSGSSWGPNLFAFAPPDIATPPSTHLGAKVLVDYPFAANGGFGVTLDTTHRLTREPTYSTSADNNTDIPVTNGVGYWTENDFVSGAAWIDLPDKQGLVFTGQVGIGYTSYGISPDPNSGRVSQCFQATGPTIEGIVNRWWIYDPADLAKVAQGQMNSWDVKPAVTFDPNDIAKVTMNTCRPHGEAAFDPTTRTLYIEALQTDTQTVFGGALPVILAYHIKSGTASAIPTQATNTGISATYEGTGTDLVGGDTLGSDGSPDSKFKVTVTGSSSKTVVGAKIEQYVSTWNTNPALGYPVALSSGISGPSLSSLAVSPGSTFYLSASNFGGYYFVPNSNVIVRVNFSDNTFTTYYFTLPDHAVYMPVANPDAKASRDFSKTQGQANWSYLKADGSPLTPGSYMPMTQDGDLNSGLTPIGGSPGGVNGLSTTTADVIRRYTAPTTGNIRIAGNVWDMTTQCGDGVVASIQKNSTTIWKQGLANGDTTGYIYDFIMAVTAGDKIDFRLNNGGNAIYNPSACDVTNYDPELDYTTAAPTSPPATIPVAGLNLDPGPSPTPVPTATPAPNPSPNLVQSKSGTSPFTSSVAISFDTSVRAGNTIVVGVERATGAAADNVGISDNRGNLYSFVAAAGGHGVWIASNVVSGATTLTINSGGGAVGATISEYSGIAPTNPVDQTSATSGYAMVANSGLTNTTAQANELVFGFIGHKFYQRGPSNGFGQVNTFSIPGGEFVNLTEDKVVSSTGQYNATDSNNGVSNPFDAVVVTLKLGSAVATPTPGPLVGDLNHDGIVNSLDWSLMNSKWFTSDATADLNHDGIVNSLDFSLLNSHWLQHS